MKPTIPVAADLYEILEEAAERHGLTVGEIVEEILRDTLVEEIAVAMELMRNA